jgi:predicted nucleic acid-binding protein
MPAERFVDTNVLVYLLSADAPKAARAERILAQGPVISVQVLNELTNVARRKCGLDWTELHEFLDGVRRLCRVEALTVEVHEHGLVLAERYRFSVYDAMIVASATRAGCKTLYSEDLQHGMQVDQLIIRNPFR